MLPLNPVSASYGYLWFWSGHGPLCYLCCPVAFVYMSSVGWSCAILHQRKKPWLLSIEHFQLSLFGMHIIILANGSVAPGVLLHIMEIEQEAYVFRFEIGPV